jgi:ribonuclease HII
MLLRYYETDSESQIYIDECARGSLFGPVYVAGVVWKLNIDEDRDTLVQIKDSKKLNRKKRNFLREYIEKKAEFTYVTRIENTVIDEINILNATYKGMHQCIKGALCANVSIDRIVVDGNNFRQYITDTGEHITHSCVVKGDDKYIGIAAASLLAKTYHDDWIDKICEEEPILHERYVLKNNMGYGTADHINGIKLWGVTSLHRKTFCKKMLSP